MGLDGKSSDAIILQHISKIKDTFEIQKIYFVHIAEDLNPPKSSKLLYAEHLAPIDENIRKILIQDLEEEFKNLNDLEYEIIVKDGNPGEELIQLIEMKQIDLLVLGRKPKPGITYFSRQLASQAPCSVIFVPKSGHREYKKILVPMDFSSNAKQVLEKAISYQDEHESTEIIPVHFYSIPSGYSKTGKSYGEYSEIMRKNAERKFKDLTPITKGKKINLILDKKENLAKKIFNYSLRKGADLIMIGSRGRTKIASYLYGSVAAKLVEMSYHLPILIDKRKGHNMNALKALKNI